jgi:hypothetical protein
MPKGAGWSDVDLCVWHPATGDAAAVEIKGWHTTTITAHSMTQEPSLFYFLREEARKAAAAVLGRSEFRSILVVSRIAEASRAETLEYARQKGVELLEFADVLRLLVKATPANRDAGSESEHVIRLLKVYGFLKGG